MNGKQFTIEIYVSKENGEDGEEDREWKQIFTSTIFDLAKEIYELDIFIENKRTERIRMRKDRHILYVREL